MSAFTINNSGASGYTPLVLWATVTSKQANAVPSAVCPVTRIRITDYIMSSAATATATFYAGSYTGNALTAISGPMTMAQGVALDDWAGDKGVFDMPQYSDFVLYVSTAVQVGGYGNYGVE